MDNSKRIEMIKSFIMAKADDEVSGIKHSFFEEIKPEIFKIMTFVPGLSNLDEVAKEHLYNVAVKEYQSVYPIDIDPSVSLTKNGYVSWLTEERRLTMPDDYLKRYLTYLGSKGRSEKVIAEISSSSQKILAKLGDPRSETPFYYKGLVVGSVQSGKTGNFNAVINRAIDAGYSLIIVLSGIMEDLRSQTQLRLEEDVIGEGTLDPSKDSKGEKGVGLIRKFGEQGDQSVRQVFSITSYKSDFKKSVKETDFSLNNKNILVCKKNTGVLKNLLVWLSDYLYENKEKHDIPFLIVDDEADNASLNNLGKKGAEYASVINGHIRALLDLFTKKTYLGYTATPFANVLQDRNQTTSTKWPISYKVNGVSTVKEFMQVSNIFPDDFIELLTSPSNYVGAKQIFETVLDDSTKIPLVEVINDIDVSFPSRLPKTDGTDGDRATVKEDNYPVFLPQSLEDAIECFILSIALRLSRMQDMTDSAFLNPHHTMLVHISRFITWQNKTKELIGDHLKKLEADLNNDLPNNADLIYGHLERIWNKYYATIVKNIRGYLPEGYNDEFLVSKTYNEIRSHLIDAIKGVEVKAVNSQTGDKLQYFKDSFGNGRKIIAVGGNRLSRGFTLEGLTINYFIRNTNYSDTLLQMGRWFGYRPGYIDCCKVFTTIDAVQKFDSTTRAIEELEAEFIKMNRLSKSPSDFVLRVRKHPGTLKITRPAILKDTKVVNWSYQDKLVQTTSFKIDDSALIQDSWKSLKTFIVNNKFKKTDDNRFFRRDVNVKEFLEFLKLPNTFNNSEIPLISRFIELCVQKHKLLNWTIVIKATGSGRPLLSKDSGLESDLELSVRRGPTLGHYKELFINGIFSASGKSANIVSAGSDFDVLIPDDVKKEAVKEFRSEKMELLQKKNGDHLINVAEISVPEKVFREKMNDEQGLLVIYLMDLEEVFLQTKGKQDLYCDLVKKNNIDLNIPLIGYAFGFPPISPDPGGEYVHGNYEIENEEGVDEWDASLETTEE